MTARQVQDRSSAGIQPIALFEFQTGFRDLSRRHERPAFLEQDGRQCLVVMGRFGVGPAGAGNKGECKTFDHHPAPYRSVHHLALFIGWRFDCLITITWPTSAWPARKPILLSFA